MNKDTNSTFNQLGQTLNDQTNVAGDLNIHAESVTPLITASKEDAIEIVKALELDQKSTLAVLHPPSALT